MTGTTDTELYIVDSSGWLEFIADGPKAALFGRYLDREELVLLPSIIVHEVYKKLRREAPKTNADQFASQALREKVIELNIEIAVQAAIISLEKNLAMADAIIYATAQAHKAQLITSDKHFDGLPGVTLI